MIEIGKYNRLQVIKEVDFGLYLSDDNRIQEILLPLKYIPENTQVGDWLEVFVYNDSENRPIATTLKPHAIIGEFANLTVLDNSEIGAFLDLGIAKDVLVPHREQAQKMRIGRDYVVFLYIDQKSGRIVGSSKWNKFIKQDDFDYQIGQKVSAIVAEKTDLGYKVIIENKHIGLIYHNEIFSPLEIGERKTVFIKKIRSENKIDISLQAIGYEHIDTSKQLILDLINTHKGFLPLHDGSSPDEISQLTGLSKKAFKKIIGGLYRDKLISLQSNGISLLNTD
jgi:hypothetical protein